MNMSVEDATAFLAKELGCSEKEAYQGLGGFLGKGMLNYRKLTKKTLRKFLTKINEEIAKTYR